jgi:hypothetical protein
MCKERVLIWEMGEMSIGQERVGEQERMGETVRGLDWGWDEGREEERTGQRRRWLETIGERSRGCDSGGEDAREEEWMGERSRVVEDDLEEMWLVGREVERMGEMRRCGWLGERWRGWERWTAEDGREEESRTDRRRGCERGG